MQDILVQAAVKAAKIRTGRPKNRKEPITEKMMVKIFKTFETDKFLGNLRFILTCMLQIHAFLRSLDLLKIKRKHVTIHKKHFALFI